MDEGSYTDDDSFEYDSFDEFAYGGFDSPEVDGSDDDWSEEEGATYGAAQAAVGRPVRSTVLPECFT